MEKPVYDLLGASEAAERFPWVKGPIEWAGLLPCGSAVLHHGGPAYGVVLSGEYIACCFSLKGALDLLAARKRLGAAYIAERKRLAAVSEEVC